ncbi:hypothetical protein PAXRUDRAFT_782617 [Paxillus rubicundulus Ve08.2h10]|uniref:Uncharacterized protein n=1 Tax=Paxillus rubicundulus Ve08.2h10 TaxID=930991 RepID=A0A0D0D7J0_9AGAM|nr:hypothetical protein PAXRUDRAFT_782617 [Paxillus rubicundulus Ve08.2h10]
MHDPGGSMDLPRSQPLSIRLKGEKSGVDLHGMEYDKDQGNLTTPRDPVGMQDSNKCHPNEPTEPPDKEEGA